MYYPVKDQLLLAEENNISRRGDVSSVLLSKTHIQLITY